MKNSTDQNATELIRLLGRDTSVLFEVGRDDFPPASNVQLDVATMEALIRLDGITAVVTTRMPDNRSGFLVLLDRPDRDLLERLIGMAGAAGATSVLFRHDGRHRYVKTSHQDGRYLCTPIDRGIYLVGQTQQDRWAIDVGGDTISVAVDVDRHDSQFVSVRVIDEIILHR